jgi:type IV pilus assembly protein PilB
MKTESELDIDANARGVVSSELAWAYRIIPFQLQDEEYSLYVDQDHPTFKNAQELEIIFGRKIKFIPKRSEVIEQALSKHFVKESVSETTQASSSTLDVKNKDFVSALFQEARLLKSSDIHIEIYEEKCRIRLRIDGKLVERIQLHKSEYPALINKIKIMAGLDISEKRLPQDGRIFFNKGDMKFDVRVSVLPTLYGEKIVLRILGNSASNVSLDLLGFSEVDLKRYKEATRKPTGIILISGPTGSGKTTTLYGTLKLLNKQTDNILTVEDPIEYTLEGINQVQVKDEIGLTFSSALRTFLRQDPDIIMVGEIRDSETASLAIRAALTGHLVLSTIHTNSAWGTISRLIDMGAPPFLLANTLNISVAQRLVRTLCPHCKQKTSLENIIFPHNFKPLQMPSEHYVAKGCKECFYTGYRGRKAIYEVIPVDSVVSEFILSNSKQVEDYLKTQGVKTLQASAFDVVCNGETSIEEIYPLLLNEQY